MIYHPQVLSDSCEEIVESLDRLADAELLLWILPREARGALDEQAT